MELTVLLGDDDLAIRTRRTELLSGAGGNIETVDVAADGGRLLVDAVSSPNLFGGQRWVSAESIEALDESNLAVISAAAPMSNAVVVARASSTLSPKLRSALKDLGEIVTSSTPKGKGVAMRVDEMLRNSGIDFGSVERRMVLERTGHDLDRLESIIKQLQIARMSRPTVKQITLLLGSVTADGVPWDLTDPLESGDIGQAVDVARTLEPVPTVAYLTNRIMQVGRVVDSGSTDPEKARELLGLAHRFQAEQIVRLGRKLGPDGVTRAWDLLVAADRSVKLSRDPVHEFSLLVVRLGQLYSRS